MGMPVLILGESGSGKSTSMAATRKAQDISVRKSFLWGPK